MRWLSDRFQSEAVIRMTLRWIDEGRLLAGSRQSGAQVRRRKPVVQGERAREILAGSPTAGDGRKFLYAGAASTGRSDWSSVPDWRLTPTTCESEHPARSGLSYSRPKAVTPLPWTKSCQADVA